MKKDLRKARQRIHWSQMCLRIAGDSYWKDQVDQTVFST